MFKKVLAILILPITFLACGEKNEKFSKVQKDRFLFGTYINITVYSKDQVLAEEAIESAFNEIARIDNKYNSKVEGSLIEKLNSRKVKSITLDKEGLYLFTTLKKIHKLSDGNYDVTIGSLLDTWNFAEKVRPKLPSEVELKEAMKKVDFSKVIISGNKMYYNLDGLEIDTGSFLKGYAIECAKKKMIDMGIESAFISSISSIQTINTKPNNQEWKIGIENPQDPSLLLGIVELNNQGMGVSGDYQTYIEVDGKRYHHILNKRTGYPVTDKKMVVVISKNAFLSDVYSTAFFTMPNEKILEFADKNNLEVLIVDAKMNITRSAGLKFKYVK